MKMTCKTIGLILPALLLAGCGEGQPVGEEEAVVEEKEVIAQEAMAFGRFVPEREDDFAWENDKVAFRVYGPNSKGVGPLSSKGRHRVSSKSVLGGSL